METAGPKSLRLLVSFQSGRFGSEVVRPLFLLPKRVISFRPLRYLIQW